MGLNLLCLTFSEILKYGFYLLIALLVLLVMITIHEFGHFIVGKKLGFKINEFAVGFGKILWKKTTKDGILITLRLIPLGGFCAFEGEDGESQVEGSFNSMAPWKRLLVLFSGAFFNFLSAIIMSFILLLSLGYADLVEIKSIDSRASETNLVELNEKDVVYEVGGIETNFVYDNYFNTLIANYAPGENIDLKVKRDGEFQNITIQNGRVLQVVGGSESTKIYEINQGLNFSVKFGESVEVFDSTNAKLELTEKQINEKKYYYFVLNGQSYVIDAENQVAYTGYLGVKLQNYKYSFGEALLYCVPFSFEWAWKVLMILWQLITGQIGLDGLGGPITTISSIASYTQTSWLNLLVLFPLISINLAVFNWLPFPALDGARMLFVIIEWIRKKPINRNVEGYIHAGGLILLFAFVIIIDILHLLLF